LLDVTEAAFSLLVVCPRNVLVGANSPSLCPTIFSVTYTGINLRPLCTAIVWLTISGRTVDRRDHVLITFFSPPRFMISIFSNSDKSTNGPFFNDLPMLNLPRLTRSPLGPTLYDKPISRLIIPRFVTLSRHTPRRYRMPATSGLTFSTT